MMQIPMRTLSIFTITYRRPLFSVLNIHNTNSSFMRQSLNKEKRKGVIDANGLKLKRLSISSWEEVRN